jgi:hypothetical protein
VVARLLEAWSELVGLDIVEQAVRFGKEVPESKLGGS